MKAIVIHPKGYNSFNEKGGRKHFAKGEVIPQVSQVELERFSDYIVSEKEAKARSKAAEATEQALKEEEGENASQKTEAGKQSQSKGA